MSDEDVYVCETCEECSAVLRAEGAAAERVRILALLEALEINPPRFGDIKGIRAAIAAVRGLTPEPEPQHSLDGYNCRAPKPKVVSVSVGDPWCPACPPASQHFAANSGYPVVRG